MSDFPLKLVVMIEATNGTTMLKGVELIRKELLEYHFPLVGEGITTDTWKVTVLESIDCLPLAAKQLNS